MEYQVGDIVRLQTGHTRMIVTNIQNGSKLYKQVTACYSTGPKQDQERLKCAHYTKTRMSYEFVPWDDPKKKEKKVMTQKLYQTKEENPRYGTFLIKNSIGQIILELRGTNEVKAFDTSDIEEVVPFTFMVKNANNQMQGRPYTCHYEGVSGQVAVDDVLLSNSGNIYVVTAVDTKNPEPKGQFSGRRLVTEKL